MRETYQKAMDHLEFAPLSAQNILACHRQSRRGGRFLSAAAVAACTCLLTLATVNNSDTNLVLLYRMVRDNENAGR